jgi:hypothetical protein
MFKDILSNIVVVAVVSSAVLSSISDAETDDVKELKLRTDTASSSNDIPPA